MVDQARSLPAAPLARCPVCSGGIGLWRIKAAAGADWRIDRCGVCGHAFVNPRPSLDFIMDYYAGTASIADGPRTLAAVLAQEAAAPNSTIDAAAMLRVIARLAPPAKARRLLDVGSGYGFFARAALAQGYAVEAIELGGVQRGIAEEMTGIMPQAVAFEAYDGPPGGLGVVLMSQILEHAIDIDAWMAKARAILDDDGVLAIALPNFGSLARRILQADEPFIIPPEHLNFFTPGSLGRLLDRHGFQVMEKGFVTRLPVAAFARRLPGPLRPLAPVVARVGDLAARAVDAAGLGSILQVYARKVAP